MFDGERRGNLSCHVVCGAVRCGAVRLMCGALPVCLIPLTQYRHNSSFTCNFICIIPSMQQRVFLKFKRIFISVIIIIIITNY